MWIWDRVKLLGRRDRPQTLGCDEGHRVPLPGKDALHAVVAGHLLQRRPQREPLPVRHRPRHLLRGLLEHSHVDLVRASEVGTRPVTETTRRLRRVGVWAHQGTSRMRLDPVVDPALIRALDVGQAAYIYRGGVTYAQVKRLVAPPAAVLPPGVTSARPTATPAVAQQPSPTPPPSPHQPGPHSRPEPALPDAGVLLDEAFGTERWP